MRKDRCMTSTSTPTVALTGVHKVFKLKKEVVTAVAGIDLTIDKGEIVAFLGPNGAGKTTTIDMILGLTEPTKGTVLIDGLKPRHAVEAGRVSAVLQTGGLLHDLTVKETLQAVASLHDLAPRRTPINIDAIIEKTGLQPILNRKVSKCSGGEQQRLKFALALLPDPDLLILDEPTAGMDVNARREFWATMRKDADSGRTIIFATHYLEEAEQFAQRTILVNKGKVIADGPTDHIRAIAAGRTVSSTISKNPEQTLAAVQSLPDTKSATLTHDRLIVTTTNSDALALELLTNHGATDLEISKPSLENAFVDLTNAASNTATSAENNTDTEQEAAR